MPPSLSSEELLQVLHAFEMPVDIALRYRGLLAKRRAGVLSPEEHEELMRLTDQAEVLEADRLAHLTELARLHHISLSRLMEELGLQPTPHV